MKTNSKKLILLSALMLAVGACKTETKKTAGGGGSGGGSGGGASGGQVDPAAFNTVKSLECDNGNLFLSLDLQKNNNGESKLVVLESLTDASDGWNEWSGELPSGIINRRE